jgi:hypothetical protein
MPMTFLLTCIYNNNDIFFYFFQQNDKDNDINDLRFATCGDDNGITRCSVKTEKENEKQK